MEISRKRHGTARSESARISWRAPVVEPLARDPLVPRPLVGKSTRGAVLEQRPSSGRPQLGGMVVGQFWRRGLAVVGRGLGGRELSSVTIASSSVANTSSRSATARGLEACSAAASLTDPWQMCAAGNIFETVLNSLSPVARGRCFYATP